MGTIDVALERIFRQLVNGNVGMTIAELDTYLTAWPNPQSRERLNTLRQDFQFMSDYWQQGMKDPQMEEQYQRLLQSLYVLSANIAIHRHMSASSYLQQIYSSARSSGRQMRIADIRQQLEGFVTDVAMLELEPEHTRKQKSQELYKQHHQLMSHLFCYILTSHAWTDSAGTEVEQMLTSPTIDTIDQQVIVSAVMLSLMNRFDITKFRLLVHVYRNSTDEYVRQRALVGWVLSIDADFCRVYPEQQQLISTLLQSKRTCRELTELQIQLVYTINAERDTTTVQREIIPNIIKNNNLRITESGIEETEDDPLEDILNPDASEQRMERLEASFQRMTEMQRQGADIYFGGFSQMKRYPFFYDITNWLTPFYMQHPDISRFAYDIEERSFIEKIMHRHAFCDSDMYSFFIAYHQVVNKLPDSMRQMMRRGEMMPEESGIESTDSPAYIRRRYLMDLYRFFRLFPNRAAIANPFDTSHQKSVLFFASPLFNKTPLERYKRDIVAMLRKQNRSKEASLLLQTFPEDMHDVQFFLWVGDYDAALQLDPDNECALANRAREHFDHRRYDDASDDYDHLLLLHPDKPTYMLNKSVCLANLEEYDDALKLLYQLNYEHADDLRVQRVLAWTLTSIGKLSQAEKMYRLLMEQEHIIADDFLNFGLCLWLQGNIIAAAKNFTNFLEEKGETIDLLPEFLNMDWLEHRGVTRLDVMMMQSTMMNGTV